MVLRAIILSSLVCTVGLSQTLPTTNESNQSGMAVYSGNDLLLNYRPESTLVTPVHKIEKPKYPAIDIHCHWVGQLDPKMLLANMEELGISHAVNLSGGFGKDLLAMLDRFTAASNGRLIIFANLDFKPIDDAEFGTYNAQILEAARAKGCAGLKLFKSLGLTIRDKAGKIVPVDDPRFNPVWQTCARLKMPVLIHSADPKSFFTPTDARNERWMQLKRHPGWSFFGGDFPKWDEVVAQRNRMIKANPETTFIIAHMAEGSNDYALLGKWLDEMPNMNIDISGRENEIGRQPLASRRFFIKYADRILFGTDRYPGRPDQPRNRIYYRMLETEDEYFDYYDHPYPPTGEWKIYGLNLPDDVLEKIYRGNAARLLGLDLKGPN
ncbi:MAG: amidohydrolase [Burkholderiales bacterium]|nr:amidohydrolase [Phycisphaerae bacterium]